MRQGSRLFRFDPGLEIETPVDGQWETYQAPHCLQAADFVADDGGAPPDFSAGGAPLFFGYSRRNNNQEGLAFRWESGVDNFQVIVYRQPNIGCDGGPALLRITKTDNGHLWGNDPLIPYEISVTNVGGIGAPALPLTETVPVNTTWSAAASSPGWTCSPGSGENSTCTYLLPILQPGISHTVTFATRVNDGTPPGWEVYNAASVNPKAWEPTFRVNPVPFDSCSSISA